MVGWKERPKEERKMQLHQMVSLKEGLRRLRVGHKSVWMLDWGLGRVVGKGLDYKLMEFFLEIYLKRKWVK